MIEVPNPITTSIYGNAVYHLLESDLEKIVNHAIERTLLKALHASDAVKEDWFKILRLQTPQIISEATEELRLRSRNGE